MSARRRPSRLAALAISWAAASTSSGAVQIPRVPPRHKIAPKQRFLNDMAAMSPTTTLTTPLSRHTLASSGRISRPTTSTPWTAGGASASQRRSLRPARDPSPPHARRVACGPWARAQALQGKPVIPFDQELATKLSLHASAIAAAKGAIAALRTQRPICPPSLTCGWQRPLSPMPAAVYLA